MPHAGILAAPLFLLLALPAAPQALNPPAQAQIAPEELGDLAMLRQQYVTAIDSYRRAPQNSPDVWNKLGMAFHHLFAMEEAKRAYERALHLRPQYPEALNNLGAVYYAEKNYKKAVHYYRKALESSPQSATMYSNLGTAYFAEQQYGQGLSAYRKAFALDPGVFNDSSVYVAEPLPRSSRAQQDYCIAHIYAQSGETAKALDFLRRAFNEGFGDRQKLFGDQTLASLRATPEFARLMNEEVQP